MASLMSCNLSCSEEVGSKVDMIIPAGSDILGENAHGCSYVGSTSDGKSCKKQQIISGISDEDLAIEELKSLVDSMHVGDYLSGVNFLHTSKDEGPQMEDMAGSQKSNVEGASIVAEPDANSESYRTPQKELMKSATFPSSRKSNAVDTVGEDKAHDQCLQKSDVPVCLRSNSLPSSIKLVSAMKGGRERHGILQEWKPRVTWAPDVVDPPVTSVSHTVRSHPRPRSKKEKKHKHGKGRSSHGSSNGRKQHSKRSTAASVNNLHPRPEASPLSPPCDGMLADSFSEIEGGVSYVDRMSTGQSLLEFAVASHDKCGSSFLRQAIGSVRLPFGEAN
ncbi:uncharacterized protein LOC116255837 isoform X1 [Nymphaea colorata]|nr:uncharacterized protein LOC116255837 isoform X1 [Nymphaea colorata]XP_031487743.1 uncharacterized protein LOC116255837 isoform X1 [Nymphaea colorata]XP_031487744.1 uncharacterized protein LOC116255837 isoform X1 [Nymphaea colorata]